MSDPSAYGTEEFDRESPHVSIAISLRRIAAALEGKAPVEPDWIYWTPMNYKGEYHYPVPPNKRVAVRFRNGSVNRNEFARHWYWGLNADCPDYEIVAYQVL